LEAIPRVDLDSFNFFFLILSWPASFRKKKKKTFLPCTFSGERTFGVVTKLDLMDKGTNAVDV